MKFTELPIPLPILDGIRECGFTECTPIQAFTLPITLAGRDVAGQAQTGTGKTAAFLIAVFARLLARPRGEGKHREGQGGRPRALIVAPTRELVVQIERDALALGVHTGLCIMAVYGGVDYELQRDRLIREDPDVLVGTPGRLIDYFKQKVYHCHDVEALVIDEADRMFDMGFIVDLRYLMRKLPPYDRRLSMLFSATLSYRVQELSYEYMNTPEVVSTTVDVKVASQVDQVLYHVEGSSKISLLVGILREELAEESRPDEHGRAMVFINTKRMGEKLLDWLHANGIEAGYLSGDVPQSKRLKVLKRFQDGELPVLIATDVAGRGLHIEGVTHVVNYDVPENAEDYVHRIGRTARAGARGDAILLVDEEGAYNLEAVEAFIGMKIPVGWPDDSLFVPLTRPPRRVVREEGERIVRDSRGRDKGGARSGERDSGRRPARKRMESPAASRPPQEGALSEPVLPREEALAAPGMAEVPEITAAQGADAAPAAAAKRKRRRRRRTSSAEGHAVPGEVPPSDGQDL
ncbi:MAG: DEAD/DEAH box helicase [Magnetococcus sp. WYHC-3]